MLFTGMPQQAWRDYYYTSIEELAVGGERPWLAGPEVLIHGGD